MPGYSQQPPSGSGIDIFKPNTLNTVSILAYYQNYTVSISTKFCTVINITNYSSWAFHWWSKMHNKSRIVDGWKKNRKIATSQQWFDWSTWNFAQWRKLTPRLHTPVFKNLRWRIAAILKNRKITISQKQFDRSPRSFARRRKLTFWTVLTVLKMIFLKNPRWRTAIILKNR